MRRRYAVLGNDHSKRSSYSLPEYGKAFRDALRPGTLRVRIAGDYRLLFETGSADTLRIIDLILRRDLDRWLSAGG